jgi:hypothetical protein
MKLRRHDEEHVVEDLDRVSFTVNLHTQAVSSREAAVCPWCRKIHARAAAIGAALVQCRAPDCRLWFNVLRYKSGRVATVCFHGEPKEAG